MTFIKIIVRYLSFLLRRLECLERCMLVQYCGNDVFIFRFMLRTVANVGVATSREAQPTQENPTILVESRGNMPEYYLVVGRKDSSSGLCRSTAFFLVRAVEIHRKNCQQIKPSPVPGSIRHSEGTLHISPEFSSHIRSTRTTGPTRS